MIKNLKIIGITAIIVAVITTIINQKYFPKIELQIIDSTIGQTQHNVPINNIQIDDTEDCKVAKNCANSNLKMDAKTEGNKFIGRVYDDCKSMDFSYEFKASLSARHIIQTGFGWMYNVGYYFKPGYLYQYDFAAIGANIIIPKDGKHFGFEIMGQKAFF